ncbi:ABC transporter ATP-binding protein [Alphaproteobacteria bacterium]|jgi:iron(III) transport system ATP-binding protein|nr:ABC transporter ATP-binding protein [Alphaproteobacteria bacterium]|tara:strand:+ start:278 stop:1324 length:1047 start_codon:yes stop_codon:yes gene_type:complete
MILDVKNLHHSYGEIEALNNLSFSIKNSSIVSVLGPSGCGKTTLIRVIAGLESVQKGEIFIEDTIVANNQLNTPPEKRPISYVFQDFALFPHMTVLENISFAAGSRKNKKQLIDQVIQLAKVDNFLQKYPHSLSGGEQQRVALARSIAVQPKLLLLDEPFSDLDINLKREIIDDTLHLINSLESSALVVTHNAEEAMFLSDMIIVMDQGKIVQVGTPHQIYFHPVNQYVASLFGETNIFQTTVQNNQCNTPLGSIEVNNLKDNQIVNVVIRPEAIKLSQEKSPLLNPNTGVVVDSKFLGNSAIIHMTVNDQFNQKHHIHSKVLGNFLPPAASSVSITLDKSHIFIFPR